MNYWDQQLVLRKTGKLSTRQGLLFRTNLANFIADNTDNWLYYLPQILGGQGNSKEDPHLQIIEKYALLLALMT
jgi:hypothetical protein